MVLRPVADLPLHAAMLETKAAYDALITRITDDPEARRRILENRGDVPPLAAVAGVGPMVCGKLKRPYRPRPLEIGGRAAQQRAHPQPGQPLVLRLAAAARVATAQSETRVRTAVAVDVSREDGLGGGPSRARASHRSFVPGTVPGGIPL